MLLPSNSILLCILFAAALTGIEGNDNECQSEPCPIGYKFNAGNGACYKLETQSKVPWDEARSICRGYGRGADLASVHSPEENTFIKTLFSSDVTDIWMGLRASFASDFKHTDGSVLTYSDWFAGRPVEDLEHLAHCAGWNQKLGYFWDNSPCGERKSFVCKVTARPLRVLKKEVVHQCPEIPSCPRCPEMPEINLSCPTAIPLQELCEGPRKGIESVQYLHGDRPVRTFCAGDGWIVLQSRGQFGNPKDYFFRGWNAYEKGFGEPGKEYWLGLKQIQALTARNEYSLRITMTMVNVTQATALYSHFSIAGVEDKYRLHLSGFSGDVGDSMFLHNGAPFSTKDQENDSDEARDCAALFKGGWWYIDCHRVNLNGLNLYGPHKSYADGIQWYNFTGQYESLATVEMAIKLKN